MLEENKNIKEEAVTPDAAPEKSDGAEESTLTSFPTFKQKKKRSSLKRQRLAVFISLGVVLALTVTMILVWRFTSRLTVEFSDGTNVVDTDGTKYYTVKKDGVWVMVNDDGDVCEKNEEGLYKTKDGALISVDVTTGKATVVAAVLLSGTEDRYFNALNGTFDILLYPMLERKDVVKVEVKNEKDHFTFVRNDKDDFEIVGHENAPYNTVMLATLISVTGYTKTLKRLDLSPENPDAEGFRQNGYAEYGLPEDPDDAKNYFIITDQEGKSHKVIIGDIIMDDTGYYARYAGRDEVYILQQMEESEYNSTLSGVLLSRLEDYITPTVTTLIGSSNYFDVTDFTLFGANGATNNDLSAFQTLIRFSYIPIEKRKGTFYQHTAYTGKGALEGYDVDEDQVDACLQAIMDMAPARTVTLYDDYENTEENLKDFIKTYGIGFAIEFTFNSERLGEEGNYAPVRDKQILHQIWVSPLTRLEDGTEVYYMFNELYNMTIEIGRNYLAFLEWEDVDWIEKEIVSGNIGYMEKMEISIPTGTTVGVTGVTDITFYPTWVNGSGQVVDGTDDTAEIRLFASYGGRERVPVLYGKRFQYFYQTLLTSSLEGTMPAGSEERQEELKAGTPSMTITITYKVDGESVVRTYRFYNGAITRGTFITINGNGHFYMIPDRVQKIINDVGRILSTDAAHEIDPESRT